MTNQDGRDEAPSPLDGLERGQSVEDRSEGGSSVPVEDATEANDPTSEALAHRLAEEARRQHDEDDRRWHAVETGGQEELPVGVDADSLRPLDASERAHLVEDLLGSARAPAQVIDLGARRRARWIGIASVAAAAAVAVFFLLPGSATLPSYMLASSGGDRTFRSSDDVTEFPIYSQGALMELVLTPSQPTEAALDVGAILIGASQPDRVWQPPLQRGRDGAIRIRARIGQDLELAEGEWELWLVIAAKGKLPTDLRSEPDGTRRLVHRFRISNDD